MAHAGLFLVTVTAIVVAVTSSPVKTDDRLTDAQKAEQLIAEQNANAHYHFSSNVDDRINDLTQAREETRDGLSVKGSFEYSDGYLRRTVSYEADENGYRIISDEAEPLSGPQGNPDGVASVHTLLPGSELKYEVHNVPARKD